MSSVVKIYWLWVLSKLDAKQLEGVEYTLKGCAPYKNQIPLFNVQRVLEFPAFLTLREYNGLMRIMVPCLLNAMQGKATEELGQMTRDVEVCCALPLVRL
jgi:hypothetical protein